MKTELFNVIPEDLKEIFESLEYEEGDLIIQGINFIDDTMELNFSLKLDFGDSIKYQEWKLITENCIDLKIDFDEIEQYFYFYDNHFLLEEFEGLQTELYIKNKSENPEKLFATLFDLHYTKFENLFKLDKFIIDKNLLNSCKRENRIFAKGPKNILENYFNILQKFETNPYYFGNRKQGNWNGSNFKENTIKYKVCVLGKNYFIGSEFKFEKVI